MSSQTAGHRFPTNVQYVKIAIFLAVVTALEVALFYLGQATDLRGMEAPILVVLSTLKFLIVIGWYMHLRFEKRLLSRFFTAGFMLAAGLYAIVLTALGFATLRG